MSECRDHGVECPNRATVPAAEPRQEPERAPDGLYGWARAVPAGPECTGDRFDAFGYAIPCPAHPSMAARPVSAADETFIGPYSQGEPPPEPVPDAEPRHAHPSVHPSLCPACQAVPAVSESPETTPLSDQPDYPDYHHYRPDCGSCVAARGAGVSPSTGDDRERLATALRTVDPHEQFYIGAVQVDADRFAEAILRAGVSPSTGEAWFTCSCGHPEGAHYSECSACGGGRSCDVDRGVSPSTGATDTEYPDHADMSVDERRG